MQQSQRHNAFDALANMAENSAVQARLNGGFACEKKFVPAKGIKANVEGGIWLMDAVYSTPGPFPRDLARTQGAGGTRNWDTDGVRIYG